jgi:hypothetical protein
MTEHPPITPREELNGLLNVAIDIGLKLIAKHGNHIPFAIVVRTSGERQNIVADNTEVHDGSILAQTVLQEVRGMIAKRELRAVAFARNIDYQSAVDRSHVDAIEVDLDHLQDRPVTCMLPYTLEGNGQPVPGELFAIDPRERFFANPARDEPKAMG